MIETTRFIIRFSYPQHIFFDQGREPGNTYTKLIDKATMFHTQAAAIARMVQLLGYKCPGLYSNAEILRVTLTVTPTRLPKYIIHFPGENAWDRGGEPGRTLTWAEQDAKGYSNLDKAVARIQVILKSGVFTSLYSNFEINRIPGITGSTEITIDKYADDE